MEGVTVYNTLTSLSLLGSDIGYAEYVYTVDQAGFDYEGEWQEFNDTTAKDVGVYYIRVFVEGGDNYVGCVKEATITITPANITGIYLMGTGAYVYDGLIHTVTVSGNATQWGDIVTVSYMMEPQDEAAPGVLNGAKSAGFYIIYATLNAEGEGHNPNYFPYTVNGNLIINKADMWNNLDDEGRFYLNNANLVYDSQVKFLNVVTSSAASGVALTQVTSMAISPSVNPSYIGDMADVEYRYFTGETGSYNTVFEGAKNANVYNIQAILSSPNYNSVALTAVMVISPYEAQVIWTGLGIVYTYNANDQSNNIIATFEGVGSDGLMYADIGYEGSDFSDNMFSQPVAFLNAGNYTLTASTSNQNYLLTNTVKNVQMLRADISNVSLEDRTVTYNGQAQAITTIFNGIRYTDIVASVDNSKTTQFGESLSISYTIEPLGGIMSLGNGAVNVNRHGGDISYYEVRAELDAGQNYNALEGENALAAKLTITPITITVEWSDYADGQIIGQDSNPYHTVYNTKHNGKTIAFGGIIDNDDIEVIINFVNVTGSGSHTSGFTSGIPGNITNGSYNFYTTDAGNYSATVMPQLYGDDCDNYDIQGASREWVIEKKQIDLIDSWFEGEWSYGATDLIPYSQFVYDKTQKSVTTGFEAGAALDDDYKVYDSDIASLSLTYINNSYVNAGIIPPLPVLTTREREEIIP